MIMIREDKETGKKRKVLFSYAFENLEGAYKDMSLVMEDLLRGQRVQTPFAIYHLGEI